MFSEDQDFVKKNIGNIKLEEFYYKKFFKFYEIAFIIFIAYLTLVIHHHGFMNLVVFYLFMAPSLIFTSNLLEQIENNPTSNLKFLLKKEYVTWLSLFGVDYYMMNCFPNLILKNHLYKKLYLISIAPIIIYIAVSIQ